jgi:hypothetical protein
MKERRSCQRRSLTDAQQPLPGRRIRVRDISAKGIGFDTFEPLEIGQPHRIRINRDGKELVFVGRIVWCAPLKTKESYSEAGLRLRRAGMEFESRLELPVDWVANCVGSTLRGEDRVARLYVVPSFT